jgi:hypothetical protein
VQSASLADQMQRKTKAHTSSALEEEQKTNLWQSISSSPPITQANTKARVESPFHMNPFCMIQIGYQLDFCSFGKTAHGVPNH